MRPATTPRLALLATALLLPGLAAALAPPAPATDGHQDDLALPLPPPDAVCLPDQGCVDVPLLVDEHGDTMFGDLTMDGADVVLGGNRLRYAAGDLTGTDALRFAGDQVCVELAPAAQCGDITAVRPGRGLVGGAERGDAALAVDPAQVCMAFQPGAGCLTQGWLLTGNAGTSPALNFLGTIDTQPLEIKTAGQRRLAIQADGSIVAHPWSNSATSATVLGGRNNQATGTDAFIGAGIGNVASGLRSSIGGGNANLAQFVDSGVASGLRNAAKANWAFVGGGEDNTVTGEAAAVLAGRGNLAGGVSAGVLGGDDNRATGAFSGIVSGENNQATANSALAGGLGSVASGDRAVALGDANVAAGWASVALGFNARANHHGTFVYADTSSLTPVASTDRDQFIVRAGRGATFYSNGAMTSGVRLAAGSGTWTSLSDRAMKADLEPVDARDALAKVAALPLSEWSYTTQPGVRHLGPMAQDFRAAFGLGASETGIDGVDADGVALAAIQGLARELEERDARIAALEARLAALEAGAP